MTIEKEDIDFEAGLVSTLDGEKMRDVVKAIGYTIDSDCEPI